MFNRIVDSWGACIADCWVPIHVRSNRVECAYVTRKELLKCDLRLTETSQLDLSPTLLQPAAPPQPLAPPASYLLYLLWLLVYRWYKTCDMPSSLYEKPKQDSWAPDVQEPPRCLTSTSTADVSLCFTTFLEYRLHVSILPDTLKTKTDLRLGERKFSGVRPCGSSTRARYSQVPVLDDFGYHAMACAVNDGSTSRHNALRDVLDILIFKQPPLCLKREWKFPSQHTLQKLNKHAWTSALITFVSKHALLVSMSQIFALTTANT